METYQASSLTFLCCFSSSCVESSFTITLCIYGGVDILESIKKYISTAYSEGREPLKSNQHTTFFISYESDDPVGTCHRYVVWKFNESDVQDVYLAVWIDQLQNLFCVLMIL